MALRYLYLAPASTEKNLYRAAFFIFTAPPLRVY
jgi:hypothetical protein